MFTEAWLHFCDHKKGERFCVCVWFYYDSRPPLPPPKIPVLLYLHCKVHVVNTALCCGKNTGLPCQPLAATLSRWLGSISPGVLAQLVLCRPPIPSIPSIFPLLSVDWFLDCPSFTATGFLSAPCSSRLLVLPATWRRSCQSCYFRALGEERGKCVRCLWLRFWVSCPHHGTLEDSSLVTVSNINMSSQSYKHMVKTK